ncbi:unnamed protein product [Oikopleura dioica]|uniref:SKA complex subunit 1 n=1 Tax=Oikopleura dioica TaxID=34765 RepID=E4Y8A6_OIKDI|nr:unnamed protein product [Oikopleura dioica]
METLLCHFDETTSAILTTDEDVMSCIIHYREILQEMEQVNDKMRKEIDDFYNKTDYLYTQKIRMAIIHDDMNSHPEYNIKDDPEPDKMTSEEGSENKENAKPLKNAKIAATKNQAVVKKSGKPKKTQKHWLIPQMDILSEEEFNKLTRHDRGRLKYLQLKIYLDEINEQYRKKYEILGRFMNKVKITADEKYQAQTFFNDDNDGGKYNLGEKELAECSFYKKGHTKGQILNILKNTGRISEKRRPKKSTLFHLSNPRIEEITK